MVKIILHQFEIPKNKVKKDLPLANDLETSGPDMASANDHDMDEAEEEFEELVRVLDKEEKETDEADEVDDKESDMLERDIEKIEEAMKEEIKGVLKIVKPVHQDGIPGSFSPRSFSLLFFCLPFFYSWWR